MEQLVLPQEYRRTVLSMAHEIPLAGHLEKGQNKAEDLAKILLAITL